MSMMKALPGTPTLAASILLLLVASFIPSCTAVKYANVSDALNATPTLSRYKEACIATGVFADKVFSGADKSVHWEATIFAPTNAAFDKMLASMPGVTWQSWLSNTTVVLATINHMIISDYNIKSPSTYLYNGQVLPSLLTRLNGRSKLTIGKAGTSVTVQGDGANLIKWGTAIMTGSYARLVTVDDVLIPDLASPKAAVPGSTTKYLSIADAINKHPGLEDIKLILQGNPTLTTYLSDVNLVGTFFVPTNKALQFPPLTLGITVEQFLGNPTYLDRVLNYHMVPGTVYTTAQFVTPNQLYPSKLTGHSLQLQLYHNHIVFATDFPLSSTKDGKAVKGKMGYSLCQRLYMMSQPPPAGQTSWVYATAAKGNRDVYAGKAIIHFVDHWLLPLPL